MLDYLLHNSYIDTARAFAAESASIVRSGEIREGLAGDVGSEAARSGVQRKEGVTSAAFEVRDPTLSEEALKPVRIRRGK